MNTPFVAATTITLVLAYLSIRSQAIMSVLFIVLSFFMLLLSVALAPAWLKTIVLLTGLFWSYYLCRGNQCGSA